MKTISITGQKGGSGKTTLAINLAAYYSISGLKVSIVDRDPQNAVRTWIKQRNQASDIYIHDDLGAKLGNVLESRKRQKDDIVIIDTAPTLGGAFQEAPHYSDCVLLPCRPSLPDIQSLVDSIAAIRNKFPNTLVRAVLTQVTARHQITQKSLDALENLSEYILETKISNRTAYQNSFADGLSVFNGYHNPCATEIRLLGDSIRELLAMRK